MKGNKANKRTIGDVASFLLGIGILNSSFPKKRTAHKDITIILIVKIRGISESGFVILKMG